MAHAIFVQSNTGSFVSFTKVFTYDLVEFEIGT